MMPPGSDVALITGTAVITILKDFVLFPTAFSALTEKVNVPVAVGVPEITPVVSFKLKPAGSVRLVIVQVIGVDPVAVSVWL